uniref:Uncharacterized protein n=1 Tax=Aegilops tauschii subsp. strangulata TaxID=200361 RepID=A0A453BHV3_AEGTS
ARPRDQRPPASLRQLGPRGGGCSHSCLTLASRANMDKVRMLLPCNVVTSLLFSA